MPKFVPRVRKQKALARLQQSAPAQDANAVEIVPETKTERDERRAKLKEELRAQQPQSKISKAKAKRLDKYIDKKLRKDETLALIKKLERSKVDTSLFASSKRLGQDDTKRQTLQRALREQEAGINTKENEALLFEERDETPDVAIAPAIKTVTSAPTVPENVQSESIPDDASVVPPVPAAPTATSLSFGSGLKQPLELDENGRPIIKKRKRSQPAFKAVVLQPPKQVVDEEPEWEGFESEGSIEARDVINGWNDISSASEDEDEDEEESDIGSDAQSADSDDDENSEGDQSTSETSEDMDDVEDEDEEDRPAKKARMSAFKAWAEQQRNEVIGFTPSNPLQEELPILPPKMDYTPRPMEQDPLPAELEAKGRQRKAYAVPVARSSEIAAVRIKLPVVAEEQRIMEAIFNNDAIVISGATGSGKTTQVPQFLFENGFGDANGPTPGLIGVTQPRRVAAVSMANRVGEEMARYKERVSYQIRFDTTVSKQTAIKFMTDGVLLRELSEDLTLKKYSVIIIDEAHERTVNTDILISLLSRTVKGRLQLCKAQPEAYTPLKLVIMSATLRVSDFRENSRLFDIPPPLVEVEGRQYGVTPHWQRRTHHDFLEDAFQKIKRGHSKLPAGGILVFLTGQNEVQTLMKRLKKALPATEPLRGTQAEVRLNAAEMPLENEDLEARLSKSSRPGRKEDVDSDEDLDVDIEGLDSEEDDEFKVEGEEAASLSKIHVLPLYSQLPSEEQFKVFKPPPEGSRLIILATNVAETSITIPNIRFVIDSGRAKTRMWDTAGVETFQTTWISKASADQRAGRAGRTGPGHVYRLYSSAVYESFADFAEPEIRNAPLERVVLQLKAMKIPNLAKFPFVTAPDQAAWVKAEKLLRYLGALNGNGEITDLGRLLQTYPLNPRFGNMLRLSVEHDCAALIIAVIAAMDAPELFVPESFLGPASTNGPTGDEEEHLDLDEEQAESDRKRKAYNTAQANLARLDRTSDAIKLFTAIHDYSRSGDPHEFCIENFVRPKALAESTRLRQQLTQIVSDQNPSRPLRFKLEISKPNEKQLALLKQIVAAGFIDQVAIRANCLPSPPEELKKPKRAIDVRYQTLLPSSDTFITGGSSETDPYVYIHPSSVLAHRSPKQLPRYIVYHRLHRGQAKSATKEPKVRMHALTPVTGEQLAVLARGTSLLEVGKPLGRVVPREEGKQECEVLLSLKGREGEIGWPLCRKRVLQKKIRGMGWVVERYLE